MNTEDFAESWKYFAHNIDMNRNTGFEIGPTRDPLNYRQKQKGVTTKQIALDMKISRRRVLQIWKSCRGQEQSREVFLVPLEDWVVGLAEDFLDEEIFLKFFVIVIFISIQFLDYSCKELLHIAS
jgi:hypothetical protein